MNQSQSLTPPTQCIFFDTDPYPLFEGVSQQCKEAIFRDLTHSQITLATQMEALNFKNRLAQQQFDKSIKAKKELADYHEKLRRERDLETTAIIEDSYGHVCIETSTPDGKHLLSHPLLEITHIKLLRYFSSDGRFKYGLSWDDCKSPIIFTKKEISVSDLTIAIKHTGCQIHIPRRRRSDVLELLIDFLYARVISYEIPGTTGWQLNSNGDWVFVNPDSITMEELQNE